MRVLAIDPGVTTGYCIGVRDSDSMFLAPAQAELDHSDIWELLRRYDPTDIVCEDFEYRPGRARPTLILTSLEYIGVVKLYAGRMPSVHIAMQKAVTGKSYYTNDVLKRLGVYKRGVPHGMDATRHLMHWLVFGSGFRYIQKDEPALKLVDEQWIQNAYFEGVR